MGTPPTPLHNQEHPRHPYMIMSTHHDHRPDKMRTRPRRAAPPRHHKSDQEQHHHPDTLT